MAQSTPGEPSTSCSRTASTWARSPIKGTHIQGRHPAIIDRQLWARVQAQFKANLQAPRTRPRSTEQSLLMGLLYDGGRAISLTLPHQ